MTFSIEKKGYSTYEVDAYIEDLEAKCQTLKEQNAILEQKLATAKRLIRRFSDTENALKQSIADSKRAAAYMISDARERSETLLDSARESCGELISDLDMQIAERMKTISLMKAEVSSFKDELFALYSTHIEMIDTLAERAESFEYVPDYSDVADAVDTFEEAGDPDCTVPEFVDYPEESIFAELEEVAPEEAAKPEAAEGDFVIDIAEGAGETAEDGFDGIDPPEAPADDEDYSQLVLGGEADKAEKKEEPAFKLIEEDAGEYPDLEAVETAEPVEGAEAAGSVESADAAENDTSVAGAKDDNDYFKFLRDFANSDEDAD